MTSEREIAEKIAEIRRQLDINVSVAKRDHPEGPIVDGKRLDALPHSQEILVGHVKDRLTELEALLAASQARETDADDYIDQLNVLCEDFGCLAGSDRLHWLHEQLSDLSSLRATALSGQGWQGDEINRMADAIDAARYAHPDHPRDRPRPFAEADRGDREYAFRLARAAFAILPAPPGERS